MSNIEKLNAIKMAEEKYPQTCEEFKRISMEQYKLFCEKMLSYGVDNICESDKEDDIELSKKSITFKIKDKTNRLKNIILLNKNNYVDGENIKDTFQDLSNYSVIIQIVMNKLWGK